MTRSELIERLRQRVADAEAIRATAPVADTLRLVLRELEGLEPEPFVRKVAADDRLLTAQEVAARLKVPAYVYRHAGRWPFTRRLGRKVRFSAAGLERWLELPRSG